MQVSPGQGCGVGDVREGEGALEGFGVRLGTLMNQSSLSKLQTLEEKFKVNHCVQMWPESSPVHQTLVCHCPQQQT